MKENWYALYICTQIEISIDKSLIKMAVTFNDGHKQLNPRPSKYSEDVIEKILKLKDQGKSYREIGEIVGMTTDQASGAVRMYKCKIKTTRTPAKVVQVAI